MRCLPGRALGDDSFIDQALLKAEEQRAVGIDLYQVVASICMSYRLTVAELCSAEKTQPAAETRAVVALMVRNFDSLSLIELAGFLKRTSPDSVKERAGLNDGLERMVCWARK